MRKRGLLGILVALLLALPLSLSAAISYDNDWGVWTGNPNYGSMSNNETVASGSNQILMVVVSYWGSLGSMTVSWGGTSMTLYKTFSGGGLYNYVYYLANPTDGTYAIRVTGNFNETVGVASFSYSGVNTGSPFGSGTSSGSTGNESLTLNYNPQYSSSAEVIFADIDDNSHYTCGNGSSYSDNRGTVEAYSSDQSLGTSGGGYGGGGSYEYFWYGLSDRNPVNTTNYTSDTVGWSCSNPNELLAWVVELVESQGTPTMTPTPTPVVQSSWRVIAGSSTGYTDSLGEVWTGATGFSTDNWAPSGNSISGALPGPSDGYLYQEQAWYSSSFTFTADVPTGSTYQVTLKFAENYATGPNQRVFNVSINGVQVLTNFDVYKLSGGQYKAIDEVFNNISPSSGQIVITFGPASANNPMVDSIQIIPTGGVGTSTPTPTITKTPTVTSTPTLGGGGMPTATVVPTATNTPLPSVYSGLPTNMRPYGLEYVPFPTVVSSSNNFYPLDVTFTTSGDGSDGTASTDSATNKTSNTQWGAPVNTARWHIVFQNLSNTVGNNVTSTAFEVAIETRIGPNGVDCNTGIYDQYAYSTQTALSLPTRPQNYSPSYFWVGVSSSAVPYTERFDAVGDPRFEPYADELDYSGGSGASAPIDDGLQGGYNWFWRNFQDGSSTYVDGAQDEYYWPFIPSAKFDHYNSQENVDVPKLFQLIREGVMKSNGIYTAMTGYDSYYCGLGGEIGGDNSNDFQNDGVPCYGGPWGSSSNNYSVDEIIGNSEGSTNVNGATYVVTGTSSTNISWMSMPFLGELWPDSLYASQWEGWSSANNGGNTTWGNLDNLEQGGTAFRVPQQDLPSSSSPYFLQTLHRNSGDGCATFLDGTNDGSDPFNHNTNGETAAPLLQDGIEMSSQYNFSLPSTFNVDREWSLTMGGNTPPEWSMEPYDDRRTHLDVYSAITYTAGSADDWGFYADEANVSSSVNKSAAAVRAIDLNDAFSPTTSGNPAGGWFIVNGLEPSTQSGINFVAQFAILSCLRTFADAGVPTNGACTVAPSFTNHNNTYTQAGAATGSTYRIPPIPLVTILHPTGSDVVQGLTTIAIQWDQRYARWDGAQYDENYPCLDANVGPCSSADVVPNPALEWHDTQPVAYNIIYNIPSAVGVSSTVWYSALTGAIVPAGPANNFEVGIPGNYMDGADAILPGSVYETSPYQYSYAWTNVAPAIYNLEVECFRLQSESSTEGYPHYSYHEIQIDTVP